MRREILLVPLFFLVACTSQPAVPTSFVASPLPPEQSVLPNQAEPTAAFDRPLRYGVTAPINPLNPWELLAMDASYENYILQSEAYPRLYDFAPQDGALIPRLAAGQPSPFLQEGNFFTATVALRPDLRWDDGSPLTAADIAFSVNTALAFRLGAERGTGSFPSALLRVDALDSQNLKYYFSASPNAGEWQYGVLNVFFVNKSYWESKITAAKALLPEDGSEQIETYRNELLALQTEEKNITARMAALKTKSAEYRDAERLLNQNLAGQDMYRTQIESAERERREKYTAAREMLFALETQNEPHLTRDRLPSFEIFTREEAIQALKDDRINLILSTNPLTAAEKTELAQIPEIRFLESRRNDLRFLAINNRRSPLDDVALRRALTCLVDPEALTSALTEDAVVPALGWIPPENIGWYTAKIEPPCFGLDADARLAAAVQTLQRDGYFWSQEPTPNRAGSGLTLPSGAEFPTLVLIAPKENQTQAEAAAYIAEKARRLGVPLDVELLPADEIFFRVYGIRDYDLAILAWSLSLYPDYVCRFFSGDNPHHYRNAALDEECALFLSTSDLTEEREILFRIEILLWDDIPALPLFSTKITEAYRGFDLPAERYWGGIAASPYGVFDVLFSKEQ